MRGSLAAPEDLELLERREGQLWGLTWSIALAFALGFTLLYLSLPSPPSTTERLVLVGEGALLGLALVYLARKRRQVAGLRRQVLERQAEAQALRKRQEALERLLALTARVGRPREAAAILQTAAEEAVTLFGAAYALVGLEDGQGRPALRALAAPPGSSRPPSLLRTWVEEGGRLSQPEAGSAPPGPPPEGPRLRARFRVGPHRQGLFLLIGRRGQTFTAAEERLLELVARATASALEMERLLRRLRRRRDQLRTLLRRLKDAQPGLILGERLKAMEELVDKVAHFLANPLTTIAGYAQLLATQPLPQDVLRCLEAIREEVDRSHEALQRLKAFAQRPPAQPRPVLLNELVQEVLALKSHRFGRLGLPCECDLEPDLPPTVLEPLYTQQALFTLLADLERHVAGRRGYRLHVATAAGPRGVAVRFTLQRPGSEEADAPLWLPFARATPEGRLQRDLFQAMVRSQGAGTHLEVDPRRRVTRFELRFPAAAGGAPAAVRPPSGPAPTRHALVVDDEPRLLGLFRRVLEGEGFAVTTAATGREALGAVAARPWDAVILDARLPDLGPEGLGAALRRERPELVGRVVLTARDPEAPAVARLARELDAVVLGKPFTIRAMLAAVQRAAGALAAR